MLKKDNPSSVDITILVPLYNEEESLPELSSSLKEVLSSMGRSFEILFIDDGSNDNSLDKILEIKKTFKEIRVLSFQSNYGKSAALSKGFESARGNFIVTMDADLQDDPTEVPNLIKKLEEGYDLVSGWKKDRKDPFIKKITSKWFNYITSVVSKVHIHDHNCGLKAYRKSVVKSVRIYGELHRFIPFLAHSAGFKVTEIPVKHHFRKYGKTKFGSWRFFAGFFDLMTVTFLTNFTNRPLHLFGFAGFVSFFLGFVINAYLTYLKYVHGEGIGNRPLLFLGILLILIGIQLFSIGLIGEMIASHTNKNEEFLTKKEYE